MIKECSKINIKIMLFIINMEKKPSKPSGYFEAILQIRNPNQEVLNFIKNAIAKREDAFISKNSDTKKWD